MKAVIPAAGLGVRFLPMTKDQPKEMLPVVNKPTIQYVVEEAVAAGMTDILIITGRGKRSIEDHFDRSYELESVLERGGNIRELETIRHIACMADIHYIRQKSPKGLGDAVHLAKNHIGDESFAVMLGDTINISKVPVVRQLMEAHARTKSSVIAVEPVSKDKVQDYGIIKGKEVENDLYRIDDLVEKPRPEEAPSNLGITGTYVLNPGIFRCLERTKPGLNGEVQLTDAMRLHLQEESMYGYRFEGRRYDIGDKLGWMKTSFEMALDDPELSGSLRPFLEDLLRNKKRSELSSPAPVFHRPTV